MADIIIFSDDVPFLGNLLAHSGTPQRFDYDPKGSGRYRQGSGNNPHQHDEYFKFKRRLEGLQAKGIKGQELYERMGFKSSGDFRAHQQYLGTVQRADKAAQAFQYREQGKTYQWIADKLGLSNESQARKLLRDKEKLLNDQLFTISKELSDYVGENGYVNVGKSSAAILGIPETKLLACLEKLKDEGYDVINIYPKQVNNARQSTTVKVLVPKGTTTKDVYDNMDKIKIPRELYFENVEGKLTKRGLIPPTSVDSNRIEIKYATEDGYQPKDGVIEIREGVKDLSLGDSRYAQVRIMVDNKYYLKGMAIYSKDLPEGVDIRFNTNKLPGTPKEKVFKKLSGDADNPFGSSIKANMYKDGELIAGGQSYYIGDDGKKHLSAINKINEEGDWGTWSKTVASQMLHKQSNELVKAQLQYTVEANEAQLNYILTQPNSMVKKKMLKDFYESCDASACDLKAMGFPRQCTKVLLPSEDIALNEVYAPGYKDGEFIALIRYPHNGPSEILDLKVNNNNPKVSAIFGKNPADAVVLNPKNLPILSGADCDGDTATIIPNSHNTLKTTRTIRISPALREIWEFDGKLAYKVSDEDLNSGKVKTYIEKGERVTMTSRQKGTWMGRDTNLIADMQELFASQEELARAIKFSQVVIDANKHKLDWMQAKKDFGIDELLRKYSTGTYLTQANKKIKINERVLPTRWKIDPETGEYIDESIKETGRTRYDKKTGKEVLVTEEVRKGSLYKNSFDLVSEYATPNEVAYASFSNSMKSLANEARKEYVKIKADPLNENAAKAYSKEVEDLKDKLNRAERYAPYESRAQMATNVIMKEKFAEDPSLKDDPDRRKKVSQQVLTAQRSILVPGGKKEKITITEREWEAINNNALNSTTVEKILKHVDTENFNELSSDKPSKGSKLSSTDIALIKAMLKAADNGSTTNTLDAIASQFGVSASTISNIKTGKYKQ